MSDNVKPRWRPAVIEWLPYADPDAPDEPSYAPVSRLATCPTHGLERVTGQRCISTGYDLCDVGVFACGATVAEDVW